MSKLGCKKMQKSKLEWMHQSRYDEHYIKHVVRNPC